MVSETPRLLLPVFPISAASELTRVSPVMIREYEKTGLIRPARVRGKRRFSQADVGNLLLLRHYLHDRKMTLNGLVVLLETTPCYIVKMCEADSCPNHGVPVTACWTSVAQNKGCTPAYCPKCPIYLRRKVMTVPLRIPEGIPRAFPK